MAATKEFQRYKTAEQWDAEIQETGRIPAVLMPTSEEASVRCLNKYPQQYYASLKPKRFNDVFNSPVCFIAEFRREVGEEAANAVLNIIVSDLVDFFNVSNSMNAQQIIATVELILDNYGFLKIDDLKLCFNWAKRGLFGAVYRMDGQIILSWIEKYIHDRMNAADEENYALHVSMKANERRSPTLTEIIEKQKKK
jgi:hypothetical protein